MKLKYRQEFTVEPNGEEGKCFPWRFPLDMLRYDRCFPTDSDSIMYMSLRNRDLEDPDFTKGMKVNLARYVDNLRTMPTNERWMTFGWHVVLHTVVCREV